MKRLLVITDAWTPQTNGVVTTLQAVAKHLPARGYRMDVLHPGLFKTWPMPGYPEIRIVREPWVVGGCIRAQRPDAVHIATEGPLGTAARVYLTRRGLPFSTSLHTKFPEYARARTGAPLALGYAFLRWFHRPAVQTLCTTPSHRSELEQWGFRNLAVWGRGVDTEAFQPQRRSTRVRPRLLYVGRISVEKNLTAFLRLNVNADKVVVGDGPARKSLQQRYGDAHWLGYRHGAALVAEYADADVLVFPSKTDTFGLVMLEAMACGTPVAAYPVTGPSDLVVSRVTGALHDDLGTAVAQALRVDRAGCRRHALTQGWEAVTARLVAGLSPLDASEQRVRSAAEVPRLSGLR